MILCCGEALIDMIPEPTTSGATGFVPHAGGAVFNTAIALGRLGQKTGLLSGLSTDLFGKQLRAALELSHVDCTHVIISGRPTTLAFVHLQDGQANYTFYDENSAGRMLSGSDMPQITEEVSAVFFGGISLACEPGADAYSALLDREGARRAVMLDPNIRPGFISDPARYRARLERMIAQADIVKISDEDLHWMFPGDQPVEDKVALIQQGGPALVILTRGRDGATGFLHGRSSIAVPAQRATVVDTVGAGDTFNAGVLAKLAERGVLSKEALRGLDPATLKDALQHGARVSAITVSRAGANPPWANEL